MIAEHSLTGSASWNGSRLWLGKEANERVRAGGRGKREHAHNCQALTKAANYLLIVQHRLHERDDCSPSFQTDFRWYADGSNEMPLCAEPFVTRAVGRKEEGAAEYAGVEAFCFIAPGGGMFYSWWHDRCIMVISSACGYILNLNLCISERIRHRKKKI